MKWVALLLGSYLLGSVSFSYLIAKWSTGQDIRTLGSRNAGATNVLRMVGKTEGLLTLLLDVAKGAGPVLAARWLEAPPAVIAGAGGAAVLGHVFPIFLGFRGGKGVATVAGATLAVTPVPALMTLPVFFGVVIWKRYVSLGSVVSAVLLPILVVVCGRLGWSPHYDPSFLLVYISIPILVLYKHISNIRRIAAGTEAKLGDPR